MSNSKLALVKTKTSLKKVSRMNAVLTEIRDKIKELGDLSELENDPDIIEHLCSLVQNITKIDLKGLEKQSLVIKLLLEIYPTQNNEKDIARLKKQITHIVESGLLQNITSSAVVVNNVCSFFAKKLM